MTTDSTPPLTFDDLAPFIQKLLGAPNEATARRYMGSIGIGASSDSIVEGTTNLFFTVERAQDAIATLLVAGTNITLTYNDVANTLTIDAAGGGGGGGITRVISVVAVNTAAGAAAATDYVYLASGTTTITLPTAVGNTNRYTVKNAGVATVSVASTSAQTFDGSASPIALTPNTALEFVSDGANWRIV